MKNFVFVAALLLSAPSFTATFSLSYATVEPQETEPRRGPILYWAEAGTHLTVTGVPFTATLTTDTIQTLPDGNHLVGHSTQKLARDSKGRTRREQALGKVGGLQLDGPTLVFIYDPVAQREYTLDPAQHTARVTTLRTLTLPEGKGLESQSASTQTRQIGNRQFVSESLGSRDIEGFNAQGTRLTVTFAPGALGNERPFSTSTEVWFSNDLQEYLLRKRNDPRTGETVSRLTNIQRTEPDPSLFQVPADYKVLFTSSQAGNKE